MKKDKNDDKIKSFIGMKTINTQFKVLNHLPNQFANFF